MFAIVAAAALAGLAGCGGASSSGNSGGGPAATPATSAPSASRSPQDVLGGALTALRAGGAVHVTIATKIGSHSVDFSDDSGTNAGRQVITITGGEHATVLLVDGVGYAEGNEAALAGFFGFAPTEAATLAGRWISFHPGDTAGGTDYSAVVDGLTLASVGDELRLGGSLTLTGPAQAGGGAVVCVRGNPVAATGAPAGTKAALCVAASGQPRPVSYRSSNSAGRQTISFSRWGEPLHLTAPPNPIAASSIGTGTA
ncbi:MAG TPA: hypothetical protein VF482_22395 [Trebonia sp.]